MKSIEDLSIWIEANRDVSPEKWEDEIWPKVKNDLLDWVEELIGEDEEEPKSETGIRLGPIVGTTQRNNLRQELRNKVKRERA